MGLITQQISREKLKPGDHIYSWRQAYVYAHHGIYIGDGKVIHFTTKGGFLVKMFGSSIPTRKSCLNCGYCSNDVGVVSSCLDCFLAGGNLCRYKYSVFKVVLMAKLRNGTCTTAPSDASEEVISRAKYLFSSKNGFGKYHLLKNNCEDFAIYCKTGLVVDEDGGLGRSGQAGLLSSASMVALIVYPWASNIVRVRADIGVRDGVKKVPVETLVAERAREG